jgi:predicted alpha/beta superfamily hydrolase
MMEAAARPDHVEIVTLRVVYPRHRGRVAIRGGGAGLSWHSDRAPDRVEDDVSWFTFAVDHGTPVELKLVRDDGAWMAGRNVVVGCGDDLTLYPAFEGEKPPLLDWEFLPLPTGTLRFRVQLPPSYREQDGLRYPVLYAHDGQSLWSDSTDPLGNWRLDRVLDELWDLGALAEIIVVAIDNSVDRVGQLGPVADPSYGGGGGRHYLHALVDHLKPHIDTRLRTRREPSATAILGSSMGGLFSLWAAWTQPAVFGAAICLSPSLWWCDRFALRMIETGPCPHPRPRLYLDSGAASSAFAEDASTRDGMHNTRAMYRALVTHYPTGDAELDVLAWPGQGHDAASWAARVAVPLQLIFPGRA